MNALRRHDHPESKRTLAFSSLSSEQFSTRILSLYRNQSYHFSDELHGEGQQLDQQNERLSGQSYRSEIWIMNRLSSILCTARWNKR